MRHRWPKVFVPTENPVANFLLCLLSHHKDLFGLCLVPGYTPLSPTLERVPGCEPLCSYNKASTAVNAGKGKPQKSNNTGQPTRRSQIMAGSGRGGGGGQAPGG